jgi:GGDEF domain-containing protein
MSMSTNPQSLDPAQVTSRYLSDLKLSRLTRFAFFLVAGLFIAWVIPYMPSGLDPHTYAGPTSLAMMLSVLAVSLAALSMVYLLRAARRREVLLAWSALFDEGTGLHNRQYFLDRLDLEIARATINGHSFRVVLLQAQRQDKNGEFVRLEREELAEVAKEIRSTLSAQDTLAALRPDELAVLSPGVMPAFIEHTEEKLLGALRSVARRSARAHSWRIRVTGSALDGEVNDPARLIDDMRTRLQIAPPIVVKPEEAA